MCGRSVELNEQKKTPLKPDNCLVAGLVRRCLRGAHHEWRKVAHLDDARDHQAEHRQTNHRLRAAVSQGHDAKGRHARRLRHQVPREAERFGEGAAERHSGGVEQFVVVVVLVNGRKWRMWTVCFLRGTPILCMVHWFTVYVIIRRLDV